MQTRGLGSSIQRWSSACSQYPPCPAREPSFEHAVPQRVLPHQPPPAVLGQVEVAEHVLEHAELPRQVHLGGGVRGPKRTAARTTPIHPRHRFNVIGCRLILNKRGSAISS